MIVMSPAYVLSAPRPAYHPHFGYRTWVRGRSASDIVVSGAVTNGPKDAILRDNTYEFWQGPSLPATLRIDFGQPRAVDYAGLAGHTIGTEGATAKMEYSDDDINYTQFGSSSITPANDAPIGWLDTQVSKRYWRLTLSGAGNVPHVAIIYLGEILIAERALAGGHTPGRLARQIETDGGVSEGGQFLGETVVRQGVRPSMSFQRLTAGWYDDHFDPMVVSLIRYPGFFWWSPLHYPNDVVFGKPGQVIRPDRMGPGRGRVNVSFDLIAEGHGD